MNRTTGLLTLGSAAFILATAAYAQSPAPVAREPNVQRGHELYVKVGCYQCHGLDAHGGVAPKLGPQALPPVVIAAYIRNPGGVMPPYAESVLNDEDVADIAAWLKTVPESPDPTSIDILPTVADIDPLRQIR